MDGHTHPHDHTHGHEALTPAETTALLRYMLDHNTHHAEELHDLAHGLSGEAEELVHAAVKDLAASNEKLAQALKIITTEDK